MPSEDLAPVVAVRMKKSWVLSFPLSTQPRLGSNWVDAQADLSLLGTLVILLVLSCGGSHYMKMLGKVCIPASTVHIYIYVH